MGYASTGNLTIWGICNYLSWLSLSGARAVFFSRLSHIFVTQQVFLWGIHTLYKSVKCFSRACRENYPLILFLFFPASEPADLQLHQEQYLTKQN